jgi:signal peptidase I
MQAPDRNPYSPPAVELVPESRRPKPWLAAVLSLIATGSGHYYAGSIRLSLAWLLAHVSILVAMFLSHVWLLGMAVLVLFAVAVPIHAYRCARRSDARVPPWPRVAGIAVFCLACSTLVSEATGGTPLQSFRIPAASMAPALIPGDYVLAETLEYRTRDPERGEIVVFRFPDDPSILYVKRIIGLPGETIEIDGRRVLVDGEPLPQVASGAYVLEDLETERRDELERVRESSPGTTRSYAVVFNSFGSSSQRQEWLVPQGSYFMLGDSRDNSKDSRRWIKPFVPRDDLIGPVTRRYFSRHPVTGDIRTERMGRIEE